MRNFVFDFTTSIDFGCVVSELEINLLDFEAAFPFLALLQAPRIGRGGRKESETKQPRVELSAIRR